MQAYHQQFTNVNLPNGAAPGLLVAPSQHSQQHQLLQQQQSNNTYQELVKAYLPQITGLTANHRNGMMGLTAASPSMTSFAVRLMSLNAHELRCLSSDSELMRHIDKAHSLIENRLQGINYPENFSSNDGASNKTNTNHQQQQMFASNQLNVNLAIQNQHHEHLMLSSPDSYYQNFYVQQQHQANQLLLMASRYHEQNNSSTNGLAGNSIMNHQHLPNQTNSTQASSITTSSSSSSLVAGSSDPEMTLRAIMNEQQHHQQQQQKHQQQQHQTSPQNGLDLRTTPRPSSAISTTPSPSRAGSTGSGNSRYAGAQHPKKLKLTEYRRLQLLAEQATQQKHLRQYPECGASAATPGESNENDPHMAIGAPQVSPGKRTYQDDDSLAELNTSTGQQQQQKVPLNSSNSGAGVKKYKGEFDEPSLEEVSERERQLHRPGHYHKQAIANGECACVIGSEFRDKTRVEALELLERWRSLDIDERVKWKWDVNDLPKDIPLSDIKKFEDLRRDYSQGRADFGGASKRKPLSIRGTRQFLLMLYCLHGHPGRDDIMQKEGYCPHCFAKIRTENEQSTLVRVVNHFNMKHRRGANPRLSPHLESRQRTPTLGSPAQSPTQIHETLNSMVESAVASVETDNRESKSDQQQEQSEKKSELETEENSDR